MCGSIRLDGLLEMLGVYCRLHLDLQPSRCWLTTGASGGRQVMQEGQHVQQHQRSPNWFEDSPAGSLAGRLMCISKVAADGTSHISPLPLDFQSRYFAVNKKIQSNIRRRLQKHNVGLP